MSIEISSSMLTQASAVGPAASPQLPALAPRAFAPSNQPRPVETKKLHVVPPAPPAVPRVSLPPSRASSDGGDATTAAHVRTTQPRGLRSRVAWIVAPALALLLAAAIGLTGRSPAVQVAQDPGSATARAPGALAPAALRVSPTPADAAELPHAEPVAQAGPAPDAPGAEPERPGDAEPPISAPRNEAVPQRPDAGDAVPARRPLISGPKRSSAIGSKAPGGATPLDSIHALFDAKNYPGVVSACGEMPSAAIAKRCVLAACHVHDTAKAQRWLPINPAESRDELVDDCKQLGLQLTLRPPRDCSNDPLDCR
jgi:hypothetical protein